MIVIGDDKIQLIKRRELTIYRYLKLILIETIFIYSISCF